MDVTCEQCKAEYDFDDTLLGDKGTTVKCSKCGHVFRVLPPRREPTRSALKVRFAHDGSVESVASLRELQQRIQAGQVSVDDQLGRDGFTFRRLGDVPELKNFFVRSGSSPSGTLPVRAQSETPQLRNDPMPKSAPKRTVMGIGPGDIPAAPRVPNFAPAPAAAQAFAPTQPAAANPRVTVQGRAPISSAPTAPGLPIPPRDSPSQRLPTSSAPTSAGSMPTASGTAPTVQAPLYGGMPTVPAGPNYNSPASNGPASNGPTPSVTKPATTPPGTLSAAAGNQAQPGSAKPPVKLRIPDSVPPGVMRAPAPQAQARGFGGDSIGPGALRAAVQPQASSAPPGSPSGRPVRLQLDEDDSIPQRSSSSSKIAITLLALAGLGGAGWFTASKLMGNKSPTAATAPSQPSIAPAAEAGAEQPLAAAPAQPAPEAAVDAAAAAAPSEPAKPETTPPASEPSEAPAAAQGAGKPAKAGKAEPAERSKEPAAESSGREPKDYSGWVARGEQLFSRGDLSGAKLAFETAVGLRASGSEANSGLGSVLLGMGQTREAIPFLSRAANNGFAEASVGLGDAYRKLGQKDEAIEAYETYLARLPKGSRANYARLQLDGLGKDSKPKPEAAPSAGPSEYRPAGEMVEPPPPPSEPTAPAPSAGTESETTP